MKCPACGHQNVEGSGSCGVCGSPLELPEAEYSGLWVRLRATLIDLGYIALLPLAVGVPPFFLINVLGALGVLPRAWAQSAAVNLLLFVVIVLPWFYFVALTSLSGHTPGKKDMGVKVID